MNNKTVGPLKTLCSEVVNATGTHSTAAFTPLFFPLVSFVSPLSPSHFHSSSNQLLSLPSFQTSTLIFFLSFILSFSAASSSLTRSLFASFTLSLPPLVLSPPSVCHPLSSPVSRSTRLSCLFSPPLMVSRPPGGPGCHFGPLLLNLITRGIVFVVVPPSPSSPQLPPHPTPPNATHTHIHTAAGSYHSPDHCRQ